MCKSWKQKMFLNFLTLLIWADSLSVSKIQIWFFTEPEKRVQFNTNYHNIMLDLKVQECDVFPWLPTSMLHSCVHMSLPTLSYP